MSQSEVQHYLNIIAAYDREFSNWETRVGKILKKYRDETRKASDGSSKFNILWSNVQTLKGATFARLPKPEVTRRFKDRDQVGRVASLILERALDYEVQHYRDYRDSLTSAVYDRFLGGRGITWVRYEPKFTQAPMEGLPEDGVQVTEDQESEGQEEQGQMEILDYECAPTDYVHWRDFGHSVARTWEEVGVVWRKVYLSKEKLEERFPDWAGKIPLDADPNSSKNNSKEEVPKSALIYEIWDKEKGVALWLAKSIGEIVDKRDDPLQLEGFWPCPEPLYATITNDTLVPVPDYALYQDQAQALDTLSDRINDLIKALQVRGVYDAANPVLARLFSEGSNTSLLPVNNWMAFAEKNGLKGAIDLVDITMIAQALREAYLAFEQVKAQVYEITGISDIVRGQSVASETATAQQLKGQYASLRLKNYQDDVARFATQMIQLKAQIICKHFSEQTLLQISAADQLNPADLELVPQAIELLRNEPLRSFRVEITSDSMIAMNEAQEKQDRVEFITAVSSYLEKATQAASVAPQIVPIALDLLKFGVQGFRVGKSMEGQIDQVADQLKQEMAQKAQQPPPPDPEQLKIQAEQQAEQARQQAEMQRFQMEQQAEAQKNAMQMQQEAQLEQMRAALEQQAEQMRAQLEMQKEVFRGEIELIKAQISAQTTLSVQQDKAAEQAVNNGV